MYGVCSHVQELHSVKEEPVKSVTHMYTHTRARTHTQELRMVKKESVKNAGEVSVKLFVDFVDAHAATVAMNLLQVRACGCVCSRSLHASDPSLATYLSACVL